MNLCYQYNKDFNDGVAWVLSGLTHQKCHQRARSLCDKLELPPNQKQGRGEIKFTELHQSQFWSLGPDENKRDRYINWEKSER